MSRSEVSPIRATARTLQPVIALGATWAARKAMISIYESRTGRPAPLVQSREASLAHKMVWAATMSAVLVAVEAIVWAVVGDDE